MSKLCSVGIVGLGFVGTAVIDTFKYYTDVIVYDKYKPGLWKIEEVVEQDVLFVCVPTPQGDDGSCDTESVEEVLSTIATLIGEGLAKSVIIKSTVPPGFCREQQKRYPRLRVIHSPEFLTARMASLDFATQSRVILGSDLPVNKAVVDLFHQVFSVPVIATGWDEAALLKYGLNCFFATKISFFNELVQICEKSGVNAQEVLSLMRGDGRLSRFHTDIPGPDGNRGYGGLCFPKDMAALEAIAKKAGVKPTVIEAAIEKNNEVRNNNS